MREGAKDDVSWATLTTSRSQLPAVCSLGGQDVREEHLRQLPEVEELISATAEGDVEVGAIFLQGSLLKILCVLYYENKSFVGFIFLKLLFLKKQRIQNLFVSLC